jgi:hypothetical protein
MIFHIYTQLCINILVYKKKYFEKAKQVIYGQPTITMPKCDFHDYKYMTIVKSNPLFMPFLWSLMSNGINDGSYWIIYSYECSHESHVLM